MNKEECEKEAKENWQLAREWEKAGKLQEADQAHKRAIKWEKLRDSWLYRTFGW